MHAPVRPSRLYVLDSLPREARHARVSARPASGSAADLLDRAGERVMELLARGLEPTNLVVGMEEVRVLAPQASRGDRALFLEVAGVDLALLPVPLDSWLDVTAGDPEG